MAISFVGVTSSASQTIDANLQIVKPSGLAAGDLMIAAISHGPGQDNENSPVTTTPPAGWTLHQTLHGEGNGWPCQLEIMYRVAGASEPGSWNGTFSETRRVEATICCAYRGVEGGITTNSNSQGSTTSLSTGSVNNPTSGNWRFTIGAYASGSIDYEIDSNESVERRISGIKRSGSSEATQCGFWDSGNSIGTGSTSRTISRDAVWSQAHAVVGILGAADLSSSGDMALTIPFPDMTAAGEVGIDAVLDVDAPLLTMTATGIASSPEGPLTADITPVVDVVAGVEGQATLDTVIMPVVDIVTETRPTGIRVVEIPAEKRRMLVFYRELIPDFIGDVERFEGPIIADISIVAEFAGNVDIRALAEHVSVGVSAFDVTSILEEVEVFSDIAAPVTVAVFQPTIAITANADDVAVVAEARPITRAGGSTFPQPDAAAVSVVVNDPTVSTEG